jgi:hypothetical protein
MVEVNVGGKELRLRAAPPALFLYDQEFGRDLIADAMGIVEEEQIFGLKLMRVIWVMNKMEHFGGSFPSFGKWLNQFEYLNLTDNAELGKVINEINAGFFREAEQGDE